jgi:NADH dehydrogenase
MNKPHVVILGGGFGGAYCAQALSKAVRRGACDVTLIDRHNFFAFYPLLVEAGTGALHPRHAVVAIRSFTGRCRFRMGEVVSVDLDAGTVRYRIVGTDEDQVVRYDHLVLSLGSVTNLPDIPGLRDHAWEMKSLADAVALRDHAVELLEQAEATEDPERRRALLHFVVVGGNYTGVEVAGEFQVYLRQACRQYPGLDPDLVKVTLLELTDRILMAVDEDLARYAVEQMRARGMDVRLETTAEEVHADRVRLRSGEELAAHTVVWCAGIAQNPVVQALELPHDERGYVRCAPDLRVEGHDNVWAIGDGAINPDPDGKPYPPTAQHAVRQGTAAAGNVLRASRGEPTRPFEYRALGALAALGCRTGVARLFGVRLSGFPAWFMFRTVYLLKMPGLARKARVALDWTADLFFRRDVVQLGLSRKLGPPR